MLLPIDGGLRLDYGRYFNTTNQFGLRSQRLALLMGDDSTALISSHSLLELNNESQAATSLLSPISTLHKPDYAFSVRLSGQWYFAWEHDREAQSHHLFMDNESAASDNTVFHTRSGLLTENQGILGSLTDGEFALGEVRTYCVSATLHGQVGETAHYLASYHAAHTASLQPDSFRSVHFPAPQAV